jgi:menaquinone-dependent protoporphyrinogen oxidase
MNKTAKKVLLVYGTRWGGTIDLAKKIADTLRSENFLVDAFNAHDKLPNVQDYEVVIVGSGIRADQWTKESLTFLEKTAEALREKKTALFVSCSMVDRVEKEVREEAKDAYLMKVAQKYGLKPIAYGFFGGIMNMKQSHGLLADLIVRFNSRNLKRHGLNTMGVTDTRNWQQIEGWTLELIKALE